MLIERLKSDPRFGVRYGIDGGRPMHSNGVGAVLSRGMRVSAARRVDVRTCGAGNFSGFYLMRLE